MKTSQEGKKLIVSREGGFKLRAYKDPGGTWTIGAGNTSYLNRSKVQPGDKITMSEAVSLFSMKLPEYENAVNKLVRVQLTQQQFDSLVSLVWNIGAKRFAESKLLKYINSKQPPELINKTFIDTVTTVKGKQSKGLKNRRVNEAIQFAKGAAEKVNKNKVPIILVIAGMYVIYRLFR